MNTLCTDNEPVNSLSAGTIHLRRGFVATCKAAVWRMIDWIVEREGKRLSRIALSELTDDQLADIGITPAEARREASQSFWN